MAKKSGITGVRHAVENAARAPKRLRWRRFLATLDLDLEALPNPLEAPRGTDFIICGPPRSGTTLMSGALFQPPKCVTLNEPWDGMRFAPADLFRSVRKEIDTTGSLTRGKLDYDSLLGNSDIRWAKEGRSSIALHLSDDYLLGIKWPAFWQYLERLPQTKFIVCLRNPVEVIASFKKNGGSITRGLEYDLAFNKKMNAQLRAATQDLLVRRVLLYEFINSRLLPYLSKPNVCAIRYEEWFEQPGTVLEKLSEFLEADVTRSPVTIESKRSESHLTDEELDLIGTHCPSARSLGYELP